MQHASEQSQIKSSCEELEAKLKECNDTLNAMNEKFNNANMEKEDFRSKLNDCISVNNELNFAIRSLENEKEILSDQIKSKLGLIESLNSEISELRSEAENVRKLKMELMLKSEDISGREASAQESRWSDELSNLQRHNDWLEERLRLTTDQLLTVRRDSVTDEQIKMEQLYGNEIEAQKQLISLYKDLEEKNEELSNAATSMQRLLKDAYESLSEEELRQLNPSVAATLSALKRGHSLTQLYSDYVQVVEDRDQLKLDKQRLTEYVEQMVDELKEKGALFFLNTLILYFSKWHFSIGTGVFSSDDDIYL
ncbi:unnamed protein product [Trichobilharzia regenti]|nr:unnamed protein product [Trichobilharzia regenti]